MKLKNKYKEKSINKIEKNKKSKTSKTDYRWTMLITMFTFIMSVALSFLLDHLLKDVNIFVGVIMLSLIHI